jgi:GAF domain-containing protein
MAVDPGAVQQSVQELLGDLGDAGRGTLRPVSAGLKAVVSAAERVLAVDYVGVLLLDEDDQLRAAAASQPLAEAFEAAQQVLGIGPGVDTVRTLATVVVNDLAGTEEYAPLADYVGDSRMRAVVSSPVWVNGAIAGNLNAIISTPHQWSAAEIAAVETYADVIGTLLQFAVSNAKATGAAEMAASADAARRDDVGRPDDGPEVRAVPR